MTGTGVLCVGDVMLDVVVDGALPEPGGDAPARIALHGGGSAANTAAWLAFAGAPVVWAGRVGRDAAGAAVAEELRAAGVDVRVVLDDERPTGVCVVLVGPGGERTMLSDRGANAALAPAGLIEEAAWVHVSGYADAQPAVDRARAAGVGVSVDPGPPARPVRGAGLLLPNLAEARALTGTDDPEAAARRLAAGGGEVVVTLGAGGALWSDGERVVRVPAAPAPVVADTAGAGDAFAAGLLHARLAGADPAEQLAAGTALAARCVGGVGARPQSAA